MVHPAILSAEEVIRAGLCRFEPLTRVSTWYDVGLDAKGGHKKVVDGVFRGHNELDLSAYGNVKFVDLTLPGGVLDLPHPLLTDYINLIRVLRRSRLFEIELSTPRKYAHRDDEGNDRPEHFQFVGAGDRPGDFVWRAASVLNDKKGQNSGYQQSKKDRDAGEIEIEGVHLAGNGGSTLRNKWNP